MIVVRLPDNYHTRQGAGAFVATEIGRRPFRLAIGGLPSIREVLDVMELRQSVEVEAAWLAAARGIPALRTEIGKALARIDAAIERGESAVDEDFAFHRAVALATNNLQFWAFLDYLAASSSRAKASASPLIKARASALISK